MLALGGTPGKESRRISLAVHHGAEVIETALPSSTLFTVDGDIGPVTVEVDGYRVRIADSPCPGQDCVRRGWIDKPGDVVICVPSGIFAVIGTGGMKLDAVSY